MVVSSGACTSRVVGASRGISASPVCCRTHAGRPPAGCLAATGNMHPVSQTASQTTRQPDIADRLLVNRTVAWPANLTQVMWVVVPAYS
jgi:hypothetical protein